MTNHKLGAIILAAGRGKRMNMKESNKVTVQIADKPLILHAIHLLEKMSFAAIVIVVGFAKKSVMNLIKNPDIIFAEQKKRLGTAHAVKCGMSKLPSDITDVLVIQGDDAAFYTEEIISKLIKTHVTSNAAFTFLTIQIKNPFGLGRIIRDQAGKIVANIEEKDATEEQRLITEVNPACYLFKTGFLKKYLSKVRKNTLTGEYYLPSLIGIAIKKGEKIETLQAGFISWRGVNTKEELAEAERLYQRIKI